MLGTGWRVTVENVRARPKKALEMIHGSRKSYEILLLPLFKGQL